jgi:hypothetical protein
VKKLLQTTLGTVASMALLMTPAVAAIQKSATETQNRTAAHKAIPNAWKAESLTGTIMSVDPQKRIVVVKDSSGVPFDMMVNRSTRIKAGNRQLKLGDLSSDVDKKASIKFVPERKGDVAETIQMNG